MFMEKILWTTCRRMYLAIDPSKRVERLGQGFPIPIEVAPQRGRPGRAGARRASARALGLRIAGGKDGPVVTEWGNLVIDAWFDEIPQGMHAQLKALPGVIETGLFEGYRFEVRLTGRYSDWRPRLARKRSMRRRSSSPSGPLASLSRVIGPRSRAQLLASSLNSDATQTSGNPSAYAITVWS